MLSTTWEALISHKVEEFFEKKLVLKYSCFTMLLVSGGQQSLLDIPSFLDALPIQVTTELSRGPCAVK